MSQVLELSRRCGLKQLKSTFTEVFKYVVELLKAPCLLFEVLFGHFLLFMPCTSLRQFPPEVGIALVPHRAMLKRGKASTQDNFPSKKIVPAHLQGWFLVETAPVQVLGKVLSREKHSQPVTGEATRTCRMSQQQWGPSLAMKWHSSPSRND